MLGLREIEAREIETRERQERLDISSALVGPTTFLFLRRTGKKVA
jgi:hypothetical protein